MQDFRNIDYPLPALGGRTMHAVFSSASAGCGADQHALANYIMDACLDGRMTGPVGLALAEMWALAAIYQGVRDARTVLANSLLMQAPACLTTNRDRGLDLLAEALSWMDELAADDHIDAAHEMDELLTHFVAAGGTEQERAAVVAQARDMREWRRGRLCGGA